MGKLRIHCFQHVPFEGLGVIEDWIIEKGHTLTYTRFWEIYKVPSIDDIDVLIVMGGPMSIFHDEEWPWLGVEKKFIKKAIQGNKKVLGICLGAQLVADSLGADVFRNEELEIGWFKISKNNAVADNPLLKSLPKEQIVFNWHGDTFDIPKGAIPVASSEVTENQGFLYGDNVLAIQFHLEMNEDSLKNIVANCYAEIHEAPYIQTVDTILETTQHIDATNKIMHNLLSDFLS